MTNVHQRSDLDQTVDGMITYMMTQIENPVLLNSRFVFNEVLYLDVNFHELNLMRGSFYLPLPDYIAKRKAAINPQNGDEEFFKWAIITADKWMNIDYHPERVSNLREFTDNYDLSDLEFPVSIKDTGKFEIKNNASVSVLGLEGKDIYILKRGGKGNRGPQGSRGRCTTHREISLLMISKNGINHYTAIKSLSRLLRSSNTKHKCKQYFCNNCLQGFMLESSRDEHQVYCEDNETVRVEMSRDGSTVEFCDGQNQFRVPFVMYADSESILEPIQGPNPGPRESQFRVPIQIPENPTPQKLPATFPLAGAFTANSLTEKLRIH